MYRSQRIYQLFTIPNLYFDTLNTIEEDYIIDIDESALARADLKRTRL